MHEEDDDDYYHVTVVKRIKTLFIYLFNFLWYFHSLVSILVVAKVFKECSIHNYMYGKSIYEKLENNTIYNNSFGILKLFSTNSEIL